MLWHPVQQLAAQSHAHLVIAMAGTGVTWVQCSPMLRLLCENILALYLTPQRCTSALPKSHRWAAVHLLCVPAGMLFIASRDWDSPGPTCPGCCHSSVAPDARISSAVSAQGTSLLLQWHWKSGSMQRATSRDFSSVSFHIDIGNT